MDAAVAALVVLLGLVIRYCGVIGPALVLTFMWLVVMASILTIGIFLAPERWDSAPQRSSPSSIGTTAVIPNHGRSPSTIRSDRSERTSISAADLVPGGPEL